VDAPGLYPQTGFQFMPFTPDQLLIFLGAAVLVTLSPGPDNLAVLSLGLSKGWKPAVGFGTGCGCGCLNHTALAVLGVSALLKSSPLAFNGLKWCGAGYLAWLGYGALRSRGTRVAETQGQTESVLRYFVKGLIANSINPKVAIFFLSFLPQFMVASPVTPARQLLVLGGLFTIQAIVLFAVIGMFSGQIGSLLHRRPGVSVWLDRVAGLVFLLLAVRLLIPETT
jgi:threonine/homoserine/homoserine lactone efflux protein